MPDRSAECGTLHPRAGPPNPCPPQEKGQIDLVVETRDELNPTLADCPPRPPGAFKHP
jgi:hypothetical protein